MNKSIFAVICSSVPQIHNTKFFETKSRAEEHLKILADERRYKFGIMDFEEKEGSFSYLIGWEEHKVSFSILEISVEE